MERQGMSGKSTPTWKFARYAYFFIVACWVVYAALSIFAPNIANQRYNLSQPALLLLRLTIIVPIHLIWLMAAHGAVAFKNYALSIDGGRESEAINLIANGLLWTIGYLVINAVVGAVAPYFASSPTYDQIIVFRDHIAPIASLIAFVLIYQGSHRLRDIAKFETWTRETAWIMVVYSLFAFIFVLQFASTPILEGHVAGRTSTSIVPHSILLFTMIVPLLCSWFFGIVATINITKYARNVKGVLYRQALQDLVKGLWLVIGFLIVIQMLTFAAKYFASLNLGTILGIVYLLLVLYGVGFLFVRSGARKLVRFEVTQ
jgi:hypothetical protein